MARPRDRVLGEASAERWGPALEAHAGAFRERLGAGPGARLFFSPGRVNLMGAHLDYNGGPVMPTAVDRGTFLAVRRRSDRFVRLASTLDRMGLEADLRDPPRTWSGRWTDYPLGVLLQVLEMSSRLDGGVRPPGLDVLFGGNLPVGAGLSSSASICVGTALALASVWDLDLGRMDLVRAALRAEREFVGVRCGIMDPFAVGLARAGQLLWLDCKDESSAWIPLDPARFSIAVADTLVRRELAQGEFNERVRQCAAAFEGLRSRQPGATCLRDIRMETLDAHRGSLDPAVARRAEHVVGEVARTFAARDSLLRGDARGFGVEMARAHESLRDLFEVSVPELDRIVRSALDCEGVLGARLTGAGFGGCAVVLLEAGRGAGVSERICADFERAFGRRPVVELFEGDAGPREVAGPWE